MVFLGRAVKLATLVLKVQVKENRRLAEAAMKTPRIVLWDELPGAINQKLARVKKRLQFREVGCRPGNCLSVFLAGVSWSRKPEIILIYQIEV
jgi:hypothetical protein